jgi:predicted XRE-type DNA-binding protein
MKQKEIQKILKVVREEIVERVADELTRFVVEQNKEVFFLDDSVVKEVISKELEKAGIQQDEEVLDIFTDFTESKLMNLIRQYGYEVHFPHMIYTYKNGWAWASDGGLTIVKE